ncbi:MAG: hypothetical protein ACE5LC_04950 [Candidatus Aminicenantales bacterium]
MVTISRVTLLLGLFFLTNLSCSNPFNPFTKQDLELTPDDYEEAELMSLCLSGELRAPDDLSEKVLLSLASVRSAFGDEFETINDLKFHSPWEPGCIIIGFDTETEKKVANGEYHAWDDLNAEYQVTRIELFRFGGAVLYFKDKLHPRRLAELYSVLPGVKYVEPNTFGGDFPNVYPRLTANGITYLFRNAWGDCPAGCIYSEFWYFFVLGWEKPKFIGYWAPHKKPSVPPWWNEAKRNIDQYRKW